MRSGDPRFATYPPEIGVGQLRWYIRQTAAGVLTIREFLDDFRRVHEAVEHAGAVQYASPEESRAIWDVLWAMEFSTEDLSKKETPEDWHIPEEVLAVIQRAEKHLAP